MSEQPRPSLASFWARLPPEGRWLLSTVAVQTVGVEVGAGLLHDEDLGAQPQQVIDIGRCKRVEAQQLP